MVSEAIALLADVVADEWVETDAFAVYADLAGEVVVGASGF